MPIAALEDLVNIHSVVRNIISLQAASSGEGVQRTIYTGIFNLYDGVTVLCEASGIVPPEDCDKFRSKISDLHRVSEVIEEDSENHCRGIMRIMKNPLKCFRTWKKATRFELDSLAILADIKKTAIKCYLKRTTSQMQRPSPAFTKNALELGLGSPFEPQLTALGRGCDHSKYFNDEGLQRSSIPMTRIARPEQVALPRRH